MGSRYFCICAIPLEGSCSLCTPILHSNFLLFRNGPSSSTCLRACNINDRPSPPIISRCRNNCGLWWRQVNCRPGFLPPPLQVGRKNCVNLITTTCSIYNFLRPYDCKVYAISSSQPRTLPNWLIFGPLDWGMPKDKMHFFLGLWTPTRTQAQRKMPGISHPWCRQEIPEMGSRNWQQASMNCVKHHEI